VNYTANLRLVPDKMTEAEFIAAFRTRTANPPMPWDYYRDINEKDLKALYSYFKTFKDKGKPARPFEPAAPTVTVDPAAATLTHTPVVTTVPPTVAPSPTTVPPDLLPQVPSEAFVSAASSELAGEYIIWVGRCNSCHTADRAKGTANWTPTTPKDDWLMGGRKHAGTYGTVYSANLRLTPQNYTEDEFVTMMKTREQNPPMPWFALHQFNEKDLRSIYSFLKSLGPKGDPVPPFVPPAPTATP
jgi:mono/diheme cytochrome c family protein